MFRNDDNSGSVSTEGAGTRYMVPKDIVAKFDRYKLLFESREAYALTNALEKSENRTVATSFNCGIRVWFVV
jgi:hypothetical protein